MAVQVYGDNPEPYVLFEDDGETFAYENGKGNRVALAWVDGEGEVTREGNFPEERYCIRDWERVEIAAAEGGSVRDAEPGGE